MSEEELKPKLSSEEEAKNARDFRIARERKRQLDYGYKDNLTKYVNPSEKKFYEANQKIEIQSRPKSIDMVGDKSKLESAGDQMAAKVALNAVKATPVGKVASMIPGANALMEDAAGKAITLLKEKIKKRRNMWIMSTVGGCLLNPITWVVIIAFLILTMIGSSLNLGGSSQSSGDTNLSGADI